MRLKRLVRIAAASLIAVMVIAAGALAGEELTPEHRKALEKEAATLNKQGSALHGQGKVKEAAATFEKALAMYRKLYPNRDHPGLARDLYNLGVVLQTQGNLGGAGRHYAEALAIRRRLYRDREHPDLAHSLNNLGMVLRARGDLAEWHYINIDVAADPDRLDLAKFRGEGNSVLDAVLKLREVLKDKAKPVQERREALSFICHFIEDLHQSLHCADREKDRGVNLVRVRLPGDDGRELNLHAVWDTPLVEAAMGPFTAADYAGQLTNALSAEQRLAMQKGTVEDWVVEGCRIAAKRCTRAWGPHCPPTGTPGTRCPPTTSSKAR
jgi:tetratricopeptide (TPR) repeat protein